MNAYRRHSHFDRKRSLGFSSGILVSNSFVSRGLQMYQRFLYSRKAYLLHIFTTFMNSGEIISLSSSNGSTILSMEPLRQPISRFRIRSKLWTNPLLQCAVQSLDVILEGVPYK
ncbi:hypothetical protein HAX54_003339, partial [Datura stramonium]|nr:hypothetical protein [Datura stramonium]